MRVGHQGRSGERQGSGGGGRGWRGWGWGWGWGWWRRRRGEKVIPILIREGIGCRGLLGGALLLLLLLGLLLGLLRGLLLRRWLGLLGALSSCSGRCEGGSFEGVQGWGSRHPTWL